MVNEKRKRVQKKINSISADKLGNEDILSCDLASSVGSLSSKSKITIRLDERIINEAKLEAKSLGVGYQRILNDRLLEVYNLEEITYLKKKELENDNLMKKLISRIEKLEAKVQA